MPGAKHCHLILSFLLGELFISYCLAHSSEFVSAYFPLQLKHPKWPIFLFASFYVKKPRCYPGEVDLIKSSSGKIIKFPEVLRRVWHFLESWTTLPPLLAVRQPFLLTTSLTPASEHLQPRQLFQNSWLLAEARSIQRLSGRQTAFSDP